MKEAINSLDFIQEKDSTKKDDIDDLLGEDKDSLDVANQKNLFTYLFPNVAQSQQQMSSLVAEARVLHTP